MTVIKYIFLIGFLIIISCNSSKQETDKNSLETENFINNNLNSHPGKPFFTFDAIDYYKNDIDENTAMNLLDYRPTSLDSIRYNLIIDETSENISNEYFINNLTKAGFNKTEIKSEDFQKLAALFSEQHQREEIYFACIPIFRDILVFKKNEKVIGVAKICFGCNRNKIIASKSNTSNFGQGKDYELLSLILNNYKNKN